jgi:uncharacterized protein YdaU (DUF1376 family)
MSAPPYMPLYWSDYQGGTTALDCEQHGAYLLLLGKMWQAGGSLPNEPVILARLVGLTKARWVKISPPIMALFTVVGDRVTQKRLAAELKIIEEKYERRAQAGSLGGRAKSLKDNKATVSNATDLLEQCSSNQNQNQNHKEESPLAPKGEQTKGLFERDFDDFWRAYPNKKAKPAAKAAFLKATKKADVAAIMRGLERAKVSRDWTKNDGQFVPHPATWLNGERWADDVGATIHPFLAPEPAPASDPWPARARAWILDTGWPSADWGPNPDSPRCAMPRRYIDEALASGVRWAPHLKMAAE